MPDLIRLQGLLKRLDSCLRRNDNLKCNGNKNTDSNSSYIRHNKPGEQSRTAWTFYVVFLNSPNLPWK